uniref:Uncharacterized protein n=1 Tax=Anopheles stephensi TaxID=30069 RepID=A0A182Y5V8_ANOST
MTTGSTGSTFPKWQLALLIGAPVAIGLGYLYWRKAGDQGEGSGDKLTKKKLADLKDKTISLDGDSSEAKQQPPDAKPLTGRELALKHKNNGNAHFRAGKYDQAISEYDAAIEHCPTYEASDRATYYQNRAAAYEQLQNWAAVIKDCTNAIECNPGYTKALVRRAKAYEQQKDLSKALEDITAACIVDHYFSSFTNDPVRKLVVASSEPKGFIKAKALFEKGEYEAVVAACTEEIESSESESDYKLEALVLRGTMYNLIACYEEAKQDLDAVIELETADKRLRSNALIKRASLAMQTQPETPGECFKFFTRAEEIDSTNGDIYHHRGQVYILTDRMDDAIADFERAYSLCPTSGIIATHLCYAKYCQANQSKDESGMERMKKRFDELLEQYSDCVECYSILAQVLTEQQQFGEADSCFVRALKVDPNNAQIYVHRGVLQLQWKGDFDEGVKLIKKAIQVDSKCEFAYETLGTIEVQRGNLVEAIRLFERAIELARTEITLVHLYSLKDAAVAQLSVAKNMGLSISNIQPNF